MIGGNIISYDQKEVEELLTTLYTTTFGGAYNGLIVIHQSPFVLRLVLSFGNWIRAGSDDRPDDSHRISINYSFFMIL